MAIDLNNANLEDLMTQLRAMGLTSEQAGYIAGIPQAQRQQALNIYVDQMIPRIGATDIANFQNQRDQLQNTYDQGLAQLDYQQGNADQAYATNRSNMVRQFDQMRTKLPWSYGRRGLANSGVYAQGLQDYADSRTRSLNQFEQRRSQQQAGYALQRNQLGSSYRTGMSGIDAAEKARRAQLAAQIKGAQ